MQSKQRNISGNLSGDGLQNGGLLIIKKGGTEVLLLHKEDVPGDHVPNDVILEILGIDSEEDDENTPYVAIQY